MTHSEIQNEVLEVFGHEIDITGPELVIVCVQWVDGNFEPQENFLGFYQASSTTDIAISCLIQDIL
ncbi:hypothetical protein PR048_005261 [Dryococelus australis]|uniref:Uncharacterized protein n=1 Tax=Dryococelus australis TaxID=614101 RepID=A0ABQ9I7M4_9NEOP|nr:hypothetical protein PR048_005261 [Dryococelus australis]